MKVLHVLSALDQRYGGPSNALLGLVRAQKSSGLDVSITATHYWPQEEWPELDSLNRDDCQIHMLLYRPRAGMSIKPFQNQLVEDVHQADVVHIHALWHKEQHLASKLCQQLGKPYVIRTCGMLAPWSMSQSHWRKRLYMGWRLGGHLRRASRIHFTTMREYHSSQRYTKGLPSIVEPNGIRKDDFDLHPVSGEFRIKFGLDPVQPIVLFLGRLHPKKGLELLLNAFQHLSEGQLIIAGPDNDGYSPKLKEQAKRLGIQDSVRLIGPLYGQDRLAAYHVSTVFVLPSYHENFGNAVIESLACGTPVVVSNQVDVCDDLDGEGVCQVTGLDSDSIADALSRQLSLGKSEKQSARCQQVAHEKFDWSSIGGRWVAHYEEILSESRSKRAH